jgi:hypothetical protein
VMAYPVIFMALTKHRCTRNLYSYARNPESC